jgi:hypothetical protein
MKRSAKRPTLAGSLALASSALFLSHLIVAATPPTSISPWVGEEHLLTEAVAFGEDACDDVSPAWRRESLGSDEPIREVRIEPASGNPWVLVGNNTILHRRVDGTWAEPLSVKADRVLSSIHVVRPGLIYVITDTDSAPGVEVYRDGRWTAVGRFDNCLVDARIKGLDGTVAAGCSYYSGLAVWRADAPDSFHDRQRFNPRDLAVVGPGEVVLLGYGGLEQVGLGEEAPIPLSSNEIAYQMLWADREHIVTASRIGDFYHAARDPATAVVGPWTKHTAPGRAEIVDIGGTAHDDLVAVGRGGVILQFDGCNWSHALSPTDADLFSIAASDAGIWVGGERGTLLYRPPRSATHTPANGR